MHFSAIARAAGRDPTDMLITTLVVVSGLTSQFDPAEKTQFEGLKEALAGRSI
jgi:hypothetical protein